jgi:hypothetical protein
VEIAPLHRFHSNEDSAYFSDMKAKGYWPINELYGGAGSAYVYVDICIAKLINQPENGGQILLNEDDYEASFSCEGEELLIFCGHKYLFVKPGKRQKLIELLDNNPAVIKCREDRAKRDKSKTEKDRSEASEIQMPKSTEQAIALSLAIKKINAWPQVPEKTPSNDEPTNYFPDWILFCAYIGLGWLLAYLEDYKNGLGASLLGYGFLAVIAFFTLRYLFSDGVAGAAQQFRKLIRGIIITAVVMVLIGVFGQLVGVSEKPYCIYRVGCFE